MQMTSVYPSWPEPDRQTECGLYAWDTGPRADH